jgi:hypothetical protein
MIRKGLKNKNDKFTELRMYSISLMNTTSEVYVHMTSGHTNVSFLHIYSSIWLNEYKVPLHCSILYLIESIISGPKAESSSAYWAQLTRGEHYFLSGIGTDSVSLKHFIFFYFLFFFNFNIREWKKSIKLTTSNVIHHCWNPVEFHVLYSVLIQSYTTTVIGRLNSNLTQLWIYAPSS